MNLLRKALACVLVMTVAVAPLLAFEAGRSGRQDGREALQRGYRTGYSDGYMAGYRDSIDNAARGFEKHADYSKADRAYSSAYGPLEDYQDGYRQGFETGYQAGFEKRPFDAVVPDGLVRKGGGVTAGSAPSEGSPGGSAISGSADREVIVVKKDSELILELEDGLDTETNRVGDRFRAKVVSPIELTGMFVEGRVSKIRKPGRIRRKAELLLSFDRIVVSEERWGNLAAILTEVLPVRGDNVRKVDSEGTVEGKGVDRSDAVRAGATAGVGAVVGGTVAGPAGVAVGAALGVGSVLVSKGRHVRLNRLQQLRLKTTFESRIR